MASRASPFQVLILLLATALVLVGAGCSMHSSYCPARTVAQVSAWGDSASTQGSNASHGRRLESSSGSWKPYVRQSKVIGKSSRQSSAEYIVIASAQRSSSAVTAQNMI